MADRLNGSIVNLHQALHGYSDGHRQLALSTPLKARDQRTLLALSDTSGPGARMDREGYLTGYPLLESGFYALARTWPAPEMPRPGCVWTHTLLIDFTELATLENLQHLDSLFVKPDGPRDFQLYARQREFQDDGLQPFDLDEDWAKATLSALYGKPDRRVIAAPKSGKDLGSTVLAIWSQQWPRLRRGFRFCTSAARDRSLDGAAFDLQLLPKLDRSVKGQFSGAIDADSLPASDEPWLVHALQDLRRPGRHGLRSFFRNLGSDIASGREAFRPLCRLFDIIDQASTGTLDIHLAVDVLQKELNPREAKVARKVVANAALKMVESLDGSSFEFLLANLDLFDRATIEVAAPQVGQALWRRGPERLLEFAHPEGFIFVDGAILGIPLDDLIVGLKAAKELTRRALELRPELVTNSAFWSTTTNAELGMDAALRNGDQEKCIASILDAKRPDLAGSAVRAFGQSMILHVLDKIVGDGLPDFDLWLRAASSNTNGVGEYFSGDTPISKKMLCAIARIHSPDAIRNDYGIDPWCNAWEHAVGYLNATEEQYIVAYLLVRALGYQSKSQAQLVLVTFDKIYASAATDGLIDDAWRMLDQKLPRSLFWFDWDRCQRLRSGVVDLFVDRDLSPAIFARLTQRENVFAMLVEAVNAKWRGRDYLKRVRKAIKDDGHLTHRADVVKKLLR